MTENKQQKPLSKKASRFSEEYIIDYNGARAARDAGYSAATASAKASMLLKDPRVQEYIEELRDEQRVRTQVNADKVLEEYAKIAFSNIKDYINPDGTVKNLKHLDSVTSAAVKKVKQKTIKRYAGGVTTTTTDTELELHDKITGLQDLGKHYQIFTPKKEGLPLEEDTEIKITINRGKNKAGFNEDSE